MPIEPLQRPPQEEINGTFIFSEWLNKLKNWLTNKDTEYLQTARHGFILPQQGIYCQEGWQDLLCTIEARSTGVGIPTYTALPAGPTNVDAYQFAAGDTVSFYVHMPHDYKWGTAMYPHVHWIANTASTNTVTWRIQYSFARGYGIDQFGASTTIDITQANSGVAMTHMIAEPAEGSGIVISNNEPDAILLCSLTLQTNNLPVNPFAFYVDMHYYSDGSLTRERNRAFTKHRD